MLVDDMAEVEKIFPRKIEDFPESRDYLMNPDVIDNSLIFKSFRDRFKTWEQIRAERYLC